MDSPQSPSDSTEIRRTIQTLPRSTRSQIRRVGTVLRSTLGFGRLLGAGLGERDDASAPAGLNSTRIPDGAWHLPQLVEQPSGPVDSQMAALRAAMNRNKVPTAAEPARRGVPIVARRMGRTMKGESVGPTGLTRRLRPAESAVPRNESHGVDDAARGRVTPEDPMAQLRRGMQARRDGSAPNPTSSDQQPDRGGSPRRSAARNEPQRRPTTPPAQQGHAGRSTPRSRSSQRSPRSNTTDSDGSGRAPASEQNATDSVPSEAMARVQPAHIQGATPASVVDRSRSLRRRALAPVPLAGRRRATRPPGTEVQLPDEAPPSPAIAATNAEARVARSVMSASGRGTGVRSSEVSSASGAGSVMSVSGRALGVRPHETSPAGVARRALSLAVARSPRPAPSVSVTSGAQPGALPANSVASGSVTDREVQADRSRPLAERVAALSGQTSASGSHMSLPPVLMRSSIYGAASSSATTRLAGATPEAASSTASRALARMTHRREVGVQGVVPEVAPSPTLLERPASVARSVSREVSRMPRSTRDIRSNSMPNDAGSDQPRSSAGPSTRPQVVRAESTQGPRVSMSNQRAVVSRLAVAVASHRQHVQRGTVLGGAAPVVSADRVVHRGAPVAAHQMGAVVGTPSIVGTVAQESVRRRVTQAIAQSQPTRMLARRVIAGGSASNRAAQSSMASIVAPSARPGVSTRFGSSIGLNDSATSVGGHQLIAQRRADGGVRSRGSMSKPQSARPAGAQVPATVTTASGESLPAAVVDKNLSLAQRVAALARPSNRSGGQSPSTPPSLNRAPITAAPTMVSTVGSDSPVSVPSPSHSLAIAGRTIVSRRVTGYADARRMSMPGTGPSSQPEQALMPTTVASTSSRVERAPVSMSADRSSTTSGIGRSPVRPSVGTAVLDAPAQQIRVRPPAMVMRMFAGDRPDGVDADVITGDASQARRMLGETVSPNIAGAGSRVAIRDGQEASRAVRGNGVRFVPGAPRVRELTNELPTGLRSVRRQPHGSDTLQTTVSEFNDTPIFSRPILGSSSVFAQAVSRRASTPVARSEDARTTVMRSESATDAGNVHQTAVAPAPDANSAAGDNDMPAAVRDRSLPLADRVAALAGRGPARRTISTLDRGGVVPSVAPTTQVRPAVAAVAGGHAAGVDRSVSPTRSTGSMSTSPRIVRLARAEHVVPAPLPAPRTPGGLPSEMGRNSVADMTNDARVARNPISDSSAPVQRSAQAVTGMHRGDGQTPSPRLVRSQTALQRRVNRVVSSPAGIVSRSGCDETSDAESPAGSASAAADRLEMTDQLLEALEERILRALERRGGIQRGWF